MLKLIEVKGCLGKIKRIYAIVFIIAKDIGTIQ